MKKTKKPSRTRAKRRIGQRAIHTAAKRAVRALYHAVRLNKSNRAYEKAVREITGLGSLAKLFEEAAARNYRLIRLGTKSGKPAIFAQKVR